MTEVEAPAQGSFVAVTAVNDGLCSVDDLGRVQCWEIELSEAAIEQKYASGGVVQISDARDTGHACFLSKDGSVWCSDLRLSESWNPGEAFAELIVGNNNTCGITFDGRVVCESILNMDPAAMVPDGLQLLAL